MPASLRLRVRPHRLAAAVAVPVDAHHRPPVLAPRHRLKVDDAAVGVEILEVHEPVLAGRRRHPRSLVRAVDVGRALLEDDAVLVRAVDRPRPEDRLPSLLHAAGGREDPVVAVALVELRTFERAVAGNRVAVDDDRALVDRLQAVRRQAIRASARWQSRRGCAPRRAPGTPSRRRPTAGRDR